MKILSLFDGISCAMTALKKLKIEVDYHASEIDTYAINVSLKNFPRIKHVGGVQTITSFNYPHLFNKSVDLLIGGSPCQDLSIAKKNRKGLDGERSGLFWEYVRILKETKPKYFILENVASMPKADKEIISKTLGVEPIMINASLVSAQNRKRLFWTNIPNITQPEDRGVLLKDVLEKNVDKKYNVKSVDFVKGGTNKKTDLDFIGGIRNKDWAKDGKNYSRNFGQGDRVYSPNGKSTTLSALGGGRGAKTGLYRTSSTKIRKLTPIECERLQGLPDNYTAYGNVLQEVNTFGNIEIWKNVLSKIVKGKKRQISVPVLCTTNDIKDMEPLNSLLEKLSSVYCVIGNLSQKGGVETTTTIGIGTMTQNIQIRLENTTEQQSKQQIMDTLEIRMGDTDTETLWKNISVEVSEEMRLYITSTLTNLIIGLKTFISAQEANTCLFMINLRNLLQSSSKMEQLVSKMEHTTLLSSSQRYKMLGNAFNVDVIAHILSFLPVKN